MRNVFFFSLGTWWDRDKRVYDANWLASFFLPFFFFFLSISGGTLCTLFFFFLFYFVTIVTFLICTRLSYKRSYIFIINITIHQGIFLIFFLSLCVHRKISKKVSLENYLLFQRVGESISRRNISYILSSKCYHSRSRNILEKILVLFENNFRVDFLHLWGQRRSNFHR